MSTRKIIVTHNGVDYIGVVGRITDADLYVDNDVRCSSLEMRALADGISYPLGGFVLDSAPEDPDGGPRRGTAFGMDHIITVMRTAGVSKISQLNGTLIMLLLEGSSPGFGSKVRGFAHITNLNKIMIFSEHAQEWKDREGVE